MNKLIPDILIILTDLKHYVRHKTSCEIVDIGERCTCGVEDVVIRTNNLLEQIKKEMNQK